MRPQGKFHLVNKNKDIDETEIIFSYGKEELNKDYY